MKLKSLKSFISSNLKILFLSILIGLFACAISIFAFSSPGSNQPPNGNPTFWLLNGSNMYYSGGSVGIGTNSPAAVFTINNSLPSSSSVWPTSFLVINGTVPAIAGNDYPLGGFRTIAAGSNTIGLNIRAHQNTRASGWPYTALGLSYDVDSTIGAGGQLWFSGGNVGIGTTTPGYGLDVRGTSFAAGPVCLAYAVSSVSSSGGTMVKIPFNAVDYDTDSSFDTVNNRFKPTKAGYYQINLAVTLTGVGSGAFTLYSAIYKNGSSLRHYQNLINYPGGFGQTMNLNTIVYLNGTTDYIEGWFMSNSSSMTTVAGNTETTLGAIFLRS